MITFQDRVDFFFANAEWSYHPAHQSPFAGRLVGAMDLAAAEAWAEDQCKLVARWEVDEEYNYTERSQYDHFCCWFTDEAGKMHAVLSGIDLGPQGLQRNKHWTHPDRAHERVVEAQLAFEVMFRTNGRGAK